MSGQDDQKTGAATPHGTLIEQIMDPTQPKNEREWAASRELARLREENATLRAEKDANEATIYSVVETAGGMVEDKKSDVMRLIELAYIDPARPDAGTYKEAWEFLDSRNSTVEKENDALRARVTQLEQYLHEARNPMLPDGTATTVEELLARVVALEGGMLKPSQLRALARFLILNTDLDSNAITLTCQYLHQKADYLEALAPLPPQEAPHA